MPPSKRLRCDDPEWTRRKAAIEMMYVIDRLSQKKIRDKLEADGFFVTKSELEAQLRLLEREQQGKASVVYYNRQKVPCNTLKKERGRYQPDALTKYTTAVSPKTPDGMELWIRTPTPAPTQSRWLQTLPWLRFQDEVLPTILHFTNQAIYFELQHPVNQVEMDFSSLHRQFDRIPSRTVSDFAVNIASMMPERAENEIANCAQLIVQGTADEAFNEHLKLILYCLSNNMYEINYQDKLSWLTVVNLIERSGLTNQPLDLAHEKDSTIKSIAENLFKLCIEFSHLEASESRAHSSNSKVISWLLQSGQNPDVEMDISGDIFWPLLHAMHYQEFELAIELLDAGAVAKEGPPRNWAALISVLSDDKALYLEMHSERREIFKRLVLRLLEAGASLSEGRSDGMPSALMCAVRLDLEIADMLIQHGAKVEYQTQDVHTNCTGWAFIRTHSVMGYAMYKSDEEQAMRKIRHLIGHYHRSHPSIPVADLLADDVVCLAAYFGFKAVVEYYCSSQNT
ncbi:ankyrin repeat containing protein [Colletotrichum camelliae]|nr:ankyrin repeat containing protein [Colletotrichum camelliae]